MGEFSSAAVTALHSFTTAYLQLFAKYIRGAKLGEVRHELPTARRVRSENREGVAEGGVNRKKRFRDS